MTAMSEQAIPVGRLSDGLKWQAYDDGIVVLIASTCESHILPPALAPLFSTGALLISDKDQQEQITHGPADWTPRGVVLQEALFQQLSRLRIIAPGIPTGGFAP